MKPRPSLALLCIESPGAMPTLDPRPMPPLPPAVASAPGAAPRYRMPHWDLFDTPGN